MASEARHRTGNYYVGAQNHSLWDLIDNCGQGDQEEERDIYEGVSDKLKEVIQNMTEPEIETAARLFKRTKFNDRGCLEWSGAKDRAGYGCLTAFNLPWKAHRLSWTIFNGPIPEGLHICHKCDNPSCVHPDHLYAGTPRDNVKDWQIKKKRHEDFTDELRPSERHMLRHGFKWQEIKKAN